MTIASGTIRGTITYKRAEQCGKHCRPAHHGGKSMAHPQSTPTPVPSVRSPLDPVSVAWAAGLIEGEGCVLALANRHSTYDGRPLWVYRVKVVMTDADVLERLVQVFGVGHVLPYRNTQGLGKKQLYRWEISRADQAKAICEAIYPFMGERRKAQIDVVLETMAANPRASRSDQVRRMWETRHRNHQLTETQRRLLAAFPPTGWTRSVDLKHAAGLTVSVGCPLRTLHKLGLVVRREQSGSWAGTNRKRFEYQLAALAS